MFYFKDKNMRKQRKSRLPATIRPTHVSSYVHITYFPIPIHSVSKFLENLNVAYRFGSNNLMNERISLICYS